jgi:hypothetical protein
MAAAGNVEISVGGDVSGQIAIGNNNLQIQNHGGVVNILKPSSRSPFRKRSGPIRQRPRPVPQLLDRAHETSTILTALQSGTSVSVFGEGGIGKTTFLSHIAHLPEVEKFPQGVVYLYVKDQGLDVLLQILFDTFYSSGRDVMPTAGQLRHYLQGIRAVILLDDLTLTREEVQALIAILPLCSFVITSLQRSLWGDEAIILLEGLPEDEQVDLFAREMGRPLSEAEKTDALIICYHLQGHPLKIIQTAALITSSGRTISDVKRQLLPRTAPFDIARTLLDRLSEPQRKVIALLGACGGALIPLSILSALLKLPRTQEVIRGLMGMGLVGADGSRYGLIAPLVGQIERIWDLSSWEDSLVNYLSNWIEQQPQDAFMEEASDLLVRAVQLAGENNHWPQVLAIGRALERILILNRRWQKWHDILNWILKAARAMSDQYTEGRTLHQLGTRAMCLNHTEQARQYLTRALEIRNAIGDQAGASVTQHNLNTLRGPASVPARPSTRAVNSDIGRYMRYGFGGMTALGLLVLIGWLIWNSIPTIPPQTPSPVTSEIPSLTALPTATPIVITATDTPTPTATSTPTYTPTLTSTYTLTPSFTPSFTPSRTPTRTLTWTPTPDIVGPPAPVITGPGDLQCNDTMTEPDDLTVLLAWNSVSDPSGITGYRVTLFDATGTLIRIWNNLNVTRLDVNPETNCGESYSWMVWAIDGAGNAGASSRRMFTIEYVIG